MTTTPIFGWTLPQVGGSSGTWGTSLNDNISALDTTLGAMMSATGNLLTPGGSPVSAAAWTTNAIRVKCQSATYTDTSSSGTVAAVYVDAHKAPTLAASSATTYTNAYTVYCENPVAGTNATLTNAWALGADSLKVTGANFSVNGHAVSVTGAATLNQDVSTAGSPTFGGLTVPTIGNSGQGIQSTNGLYSGTFSQLAAVSGTFYTAIPYATLSPATGLSLWLVMVCCENLSAGVFVLTSPTTASPGITATQLAAGTNISAQIDGSGNFQVKQTNGSNQTLQAIWFRVGQ